MTAITFDTHAFIKRLTAAGMPEQQAEAVTTMVGEARDAEASQLATKADILAVKGEILAAKSELKAEMSELKAEMMKWMIGALGFQTLAILGGLAALLKLAAK